MSTLPPTPPYNPNVPVVTAAGGRAESYADPTSPESILRKTATLKAQTSVDTKYDVAVSPYDGFQDMSRNKYLQYIILAFIIVGLILLFGKKSLPSYKKIFIVCIIILLFLIYALLQNGS